MAQRRAEKHKKVKLSKKQQEVVLGMSFQKSVVRSFFYVSPEDYQFDGWPLFFHRNKGL